MDLGGFCFFFFSSFFPSHFRFSYVQTRLVFVGQALRSRILCSIYPPNDLVPSSKLQYHQRFSQEAGTLSSNMTFSVTLISHWMRMGSCM